MRPYDLPPGVSPDVAMLATGQIPGGPPDPVKQVTEPPAPRFDPLHPFATTEGVVPYAHETAEDLTDGIDDALAALPPSFAQERGAPRGLEASPHAQPAVLPEPSLAEDVGLPDEGPDEDAQKALAALYGDSFPLLDLTRDREPHDGAWAAWAKGLWDKHASAMTPVLHLVERNRLMRNNVQWISSQGFGPWREPPKPREATRATDNVIAPALDLRVEIVSEQRPGFRTKPESQDQRALKRAEAQQAFLEYQYDAQRMADVIKEAAYWAGTDGVSFLCSYWDPDAGPWTETGGQGAPEKPGGDIRTHVYRIEQVRVSAEATATRRPSYWVIRERVPLAQAVRELGAKVLGDAQEATGADDTLARTTPAIRYGAEVATPDTMLRDQRTVDRFTVHCERSEYLPKGLTVVVVGGALAAGPLPLLAGRAPVVRFTDGSTDPAFYPQAVMNGWVDSQMRINVLKSKWIDSIRLNAGGRFIGRENEIKGETLVGGMTSVISVATSAASIRDVVMPIQGFSVGDDAKELFEIEKKAFEDRSGWNDAARGSFASDQSGRAILAIREQLERIHAPTVNAAARAMSEWGELQIAWAKWGYDLPRLIAVEGRGRPDLAREVIAEDFDGVVNVGVDAETLVPLPRALRSFMLDSMYDKGMISAQEYRRRQPFAFTQNLDSADSDHQARARRVCESIRQHVQSGGAAPLVPMLYMDDEAIHKDVLFRELIAPDDLPQQVRMIAYDRWMALDQQAQFKAMGGTGAGMMAAQGAPSGPSQGAPANNRQISGTSSPFPAASQPFAGTSPGVSAGTATMMAGNDVETRARQFDQAVRQ